MEKCTICFGFEITNWNYFEDGLILELPNNSQIIRLYKNKDRITCSIVENNSIQAEYESQPLHFANNSGEISIGIAWDENEINYIILNGLFVDKSTNSNVLECSFENTVQNMGIIYNNSNIKSKCTAWINWRNIHYAFPQQNSKDDKIVKSIEEQFAELNNSIKELRHLSEEVFLKNQDYLLPSIYAKLRVLLFWPDNIKNKSYKPLLIRLAGFLKLPLPLYAYPNDMHYKKFLAIHSIGYKPSFSIQYNHASIDKKEVGMDIVDLQEWLNSLFVDVNGEINYRLKDFIFDLSNTFGAHNDEDVSKKVKTLKDFAVKNSNGVKSIIENVTLVTINSGLYVLNEYKKIKKIN